MSSRGRLFTRLPPLVRVPDLSDAIGAGAVSGNEAWEGCAEFGGEVVRRPRGRPRKAGRRKRSGDLVVRPDKPAAITATMPHRRALGRRRLISWLRE
jgi:hypothetical protein